MKDLKTIAKNYQVPTEQKEEVVIDDFAKGIIDRVFNNLAIIFPAWKHNWKSDDPSDPDKVLRAAKREWTKAFIENKICTMEQIKCGFAKARQSESDFLPSCGKFISWCQPSAEDLGYPSEREAMKECVNYRNSQRMFYSDTIAVRPFIAELTKRVDWWLINNASTNEQIRKSEKHFSEVYIEMINTYVEPEATEAPRLPTKRMVEENLSLTQRSDRKERAQKAIDEIKLKLKNRNS